MSSQVAMALCCAMFGMVLLSADALAQQKATKPCARDWHADRPVGQATRLAESPPVAPCRPAASESRAGKAAKQRPVQSSIKDIMDGYCVKLDINDSTAEAVSKFQEYDRTVLPVTNTSNVLLGVITVDDVMDVQEQQDREALQHSEDILALSIVPAR